MQMIANIKKRLLRRPDLRSGLLAMTTFFSSLRALDTKCQGRSNLKKEAVGIDIAEGRITVVVLKTAPEAAVKDFTVKQLSVPYTDEDIAKTLQDIFASKRLFKNEAWLNIGLPSPDLYFGRLSLPVMPQPELPGAIRWNLKDKASLDVKDAQLAYEVVGESQKEDGSKTLTITAVLAQNAVIDRFLNIFKKAGITLAGINVSPFSISNVLGQEGTVLVCDVGVEYSYLSIYVNGKLDFVRQVPFALMSFLNAMTGVLVSDKGRVELTAQDARKIAEEVGIPSQTDTVLGGRVMGAQLIAMVRPVIERFSGEILRSIQYYQGELAGGKVEKVLLTGEGARLKGLTEIISRELNLSVEGLKLPPALSTATAPGVPTPGASAPGAVVGGIHKRGINLLPEEAKQAKKDAATKSAIRLSTVAVLGMLFLSFLASSIQTASYKRQLSLARNQALILKDLKEALDRIGLRQAVVSNVRKKEVPADMVLKELSRSTPGNIALLELWLSQKQKTLRLKGRVLAKPEVVGGVLSDFTEVLERSPFVKDAALSNVKKEAAETGGISAFELSVRLIE